MWYPLFNLTYGSFSETVLDPVQQESSWFGRSAGRTGKAGHSMGGSWNDPKLPWQIVFPVDSGSRGCSGWSWSMVSSDVLKTVGICCCWLLLHQRILWSRQNSSIGKVFTSDACTAGQLCHFCVIKPVLIQLARVAFKSKGNYFVAVVMKNAEWQIPWAVLCIAAVVLSTYGAGLLPALMISLLSLVTFIACSVRCVL